MAARTLSARLRLGLRLAERCQAIPEAEALPAPGTSSGHVTVASSDIHIVWTIRE